MKNAKRHAVAASPASVAPSRAAASRPRHFDTVVKVGDRITFDPTGEQLRVAKIENGQITFEKLP